ncbi:MAG TPA: YceH family protein [Pirellulales bacterium]
MSDQSQAAVSAFSGQQPPKWKPLGRIDRRVAGVLVEKAKTTPEQYPMTLNGLVNGCNQKSNRDPQMQLEESDIVDALDRLKQAGAVVEVQGSGRVNKFRHLMYEWLGVDKVELAVMAELLLRGGQTEGEMRTRASRMEPIADLGAMRTILDNLRGKKLVVDLTPPGRGQLISHNLYQVEELQRIKEKSVGRSGDDDAPAPVRSVTPSGHAGPTATASHHSPAPVAASHSADELRSIRSELAELREELETLAATVNQQQRAISDLRSALGG